MILCLAHADFIGPKLGGEIVELSTGRMQPHYSSTMLNNARVEPQLISNMHSLSWIACLVSHISILSQCFIAVGGLNMT